MKSRARASFAALAAWLALAIACASIAAPVHALELRIDASFTGSNFLQSVLPPNPRPDVAGAVGPAHFVELLSGRYAVYDRGTGALLQSSSHVDFWRSAGVPEPVDFAFDPRIAYDSASGRWYAAAQTFENVATADGLLAVAVSRSADPADGWVGFHIDADPTQVNWLDTTTLGMDADALYVTTTRQRPVTEAAVGTAVVVLPKADLVAPVPSVASVTVFRTTFAQTGFDAQPAIDLDGTGLPMPLLSGNGALFGQIQVARVDGPIAAPSLTGGLVIPVDPMPGPLDAQQPGDKLDIESTAGIPTFPSSTVLQNGSLWAVQGVTVDDRAALRWFEIEPTTNVVLQSGVIADPERDFYTPSIAVNELDQVVIGFTGSSEAIFPSAYAVAGARIGDSTVFGDPLLLRAGVSDYESLDRFGRNRWGDFSTTLVDPTDPLAFWTFQEFVFDTDVWGISITRLRVPEPVSDAMLLLGLAGLAARAHRKARRGRSCGAARS